MIDAYSEHITPLGQSAWITVCPRHSFLQDYPLPNDLRYNYVTSAEVQAILKWWMLPHGDRGMRVNESEVDMGDAGYHNIFKTPIIMGRFK